MRHMVYVADMVNCQLATDIHACLTKRASPKYSEEIADISRFDVLHSLGFLPTPSAGVTMHP